ncbi:hypothetical protein [Amycolatopsis sp.]|jgi:hypothetical protein|uniref:hypothetical protein n=1 Tax=Amycolatopsis sp. TaxID=37632 RepID=UPI002DFFC88D|nr:hypothetical protein [Amycolatopsis sp.]
MATQLPVRIEFSLPEGWTAAPPDEVGAPGAAFVALHPPAHDGFTTNITISGDYRDDDVELETVAGESVARLKKSVGEVRVLTSTAVDAGFTQTLEIKSTIEGQPHDLVQCQAYLSMHDVDEPAKRAIIDLVLTTTADRFDEFVKDFQNFVRSVKPSEYFPL